MGILRDDPWGHLPRPFSPGTVIPSNRSPGEWHFTFRDGEGHEYHWRATDFGLASDAKLEMRRFCARHGCVELEEYLDEEKHPGSGRNLWSGRAARSGG